MCKWTKFLILVRVAAIVLAGGGLASSLSAQTPVPYTPPGYSVPGAPSPYYQPGNLNIPYGYPQNWVYYPYGPVYGWGYGVNPWYYGYPVWTYVPSGYPPGTFGDSSSSSRQDRPATTFGSPPADSSLTGTDGQPTRLRPYPVSPNEIDKTPVVNARLANRDEIAKHLPADVKLDTVASCGDMGKNKIIVEQELARVGAFISTDGKLRSRSGREIYFHHMIGCWGNPPGNYMQLWEEENRTLERLRQQYTVITLTCNPSGMPVP